MSSFRDKTKGRWKGILPQFGIATSLLTGKHQACPQCGGKDRWRFDDKDGTGSWFCTNCGSGSGSDLIMMKKGWDFKTTAAEVEAIIGSVKMDRAKPQRSQTAKRASLQRMWDESKAITRGDPVSRWLHNRVGNILFPSCLRYAERIVYAGDPPTYHPAMIARVDGPDGLPQTIHRTYITPDGQKADVGETRRLMPGTFEPGSAVRLFEPREGVLAIAEGIETALAVLKIAAIPCWATINTANMQAFTPPDDVKEIFIFADHDKNFAGQAAAYALAKKLATNRTVQGILPEQSGTDWNDVLKEKFKIVQKSSEMGLHECKPSDT